MPQAPIIISVNLQLQPVEDSWKEKAAQIVSWERSTKFNIGMDTRWFEGKLTLNAEYFKNRTNILKTPSRTNIISGVTSFLHKI